MTTSLDAVAAVVFAGALAAVVALCAGAVIAIVRMRAPVHGWRDQIRSALYVLRFDNALEWKGVGRVERRARRDELRLSIADAAADGGVPAALTRLGSPSELARAGSGLPGNPGWGRGTAVTAGAVIAYFYAVVVGLDLVSSSLEKLGVADASLRVSTLFLPGATLEFATNANGQVNMIGTEFNLLVVLVPILVFVIASRAWRVIAKRASDRAASADA